MSATQYSTTQALGQELLQECAKVDADAAKAYRLARQGADTNLRDGNGRSSTELARKNNRQDIVTMLSQYGRAQAPIASVVPAAIPGAVSLFNKFAGAKQAKEAQRLQTVSDILSGAAEDLKQGIDRYARNPGRADDLSRTVYGWGSTALHLVTFTTENFQRLREDAKNYALVESVSFDEIRASKGYLKLLEAAAAPDIDLAVELVNMPVLRGRTGFTAIIHTDKKFSASPDAPLLVVSQIAAATSIPSPSTLKPMRPLKLKNTGTTP